MGIARKVVSNTGPIMHLFEVDLLKALSAFKEVYIPEEVKNELQKNKVKTALKNIKMLKLNAKFKDVAEILTNKFSLDLGEAEAIALALQEKADYFLTDDLDARTVANTHGLEAHGTVGVILRAFREKIVDKKTAIEKINQLYTTSSLFITKDLIKDILKSISEFKR